MFLLFFMAMQQLDKLIFGMCMEKFKRKKKGKTCHTKCKTVSRDWLGHGSKTLRHRLHNFVKKKKKRMIFYDFRKHRAICFRINRTLFCSAMSFEPWPVLSSASCLPTTLPKLFSATENLRHIHICCFYPTRQTHSDSGIWWNGKHCHLCD